MRPRRTLAPAPTHAPTATLAPAPRRALAPTPVRVLAPLLALALLLAGCLDAAPATPDAGGALDAAPAPRVGFFTQDMGLAAEAPADPGAVRAGSFFQAWAEGSDYPTWESAPFDAPAGVGNLSAKLFLRSTGPVVESGRFPDVMVYGGAGGSWMGFASTKFASVLVPGQVYELDLSLSVPEGGLVVPAGERLGLKVVPVMHQNEQADVEILVGGATASGANWTQAPVALPEVALVHGRTTGEATGSAYAGPAAPESTRFRHVVTTNATPQVFLVWMNTTDATGVPDIDLLLVAPDGSEVASSGTPTPREMLRLHAPNLAPYGAGDYTIVVASYGSARASFTVEWFVG